jgi:hypothetical protein
MFKFTNSKLYGMCALLFTLFLAGCDNQNPGNVIPQKVSMGADEYSSDFARAWYTQLCKATKTTAGYYPPMASRVFGYMGVTLYESVVHGIPNAKSLAGQLNGLAVGALPQPESTKEYNWSLVANAALATTMRNFFPVSFSSGAKNHVSIDSLETKYKTVLSTNISPDVVDNSVQYGKALATAIFEYAKTDGGHEAYLTPFAGKEIIPTGAQYWVPTNGTDAMGANWGKNRFMLSANISVRISPHLAFSTDPNSAFYKQALEVYRQKSLNTADQEEIARFWADNPFETCTPTGHTVSIMTQLLDETHATLAKAAVAYAKISIAEYEAFIACWREKYTYALLRPVTYIKRHIDPNWEPLIGTPPFPAYVSGHSTETGAASRVFISTFGPNYTFTDRSQLLYGFSRTQRSFTSFEQMSQESAFSRLYGGIHYRMDVEEGLTLGKRIGDNVVALLDMPRGLN